MEEHKECGAMESHLQDGHHILRFHSPDKIEKEEARKQYHLLTLDRSRINEDIDQLKADEQVINRKLMWFSQHDLYIKLTMEEIESHECYLGKTRSVSRTTDYLRFPEEYARTLVAPDRKLSQKRLMIKKGRMDIDHLQQVKEQLLSIKKSGGITLTSSGTQQVNDLIESMAQLIHHGSKNRVEEMRIYLETRNLMETREGYIASEPDQNHSDNWYSIERPSKYNVDFKRNLQHKINIRLDDIEDLKMDLKGRKGRVRRLKAELELVRKSISCLQKKLEDVNTKRIKTYKRAYDLGVQKTGLVQ